MIDKMRKLATIGYVVFALFSCSVVVVGFWVEFGIEPALITAIFFVCLIPSVLVVLLSD